MPLPAQGQPVSVSQLNENIPNVPRAGNYANTRISELTSLYSHIDQATPHKISEFFDPLPPLAQFDYMVVRYGWTNAGGSDLDTFTGFVNTGTAYDNDWVGYGQGDAKVPAAAANPYLHWGGDNTNTYGVEAVMVNMAKFILDTAIAQNTIEVLMSAVWYGARYTGDMTVQLETYSGGTMVYDSATKDFTNSGGTVVNSVTLARNVVNRNTSAIQANADQVARLTYNKSSNTATITLL